MVGHHPTTLLRRDFVGLHVNDGTICSAGFTPLTFIFPANAFFPLVSKEGSNKP